MATCARCGGFGYVRYSRGSHMVLDCPGCGGKRQAKAAREAEEERRRQRLLITALEQERKRRESVVYMLMPAVGDGQD